jgi:hypothetical protein
VAILSTWRSEWEGIESGDPGGLVTAVGAGDVAYLNWPASTPSPERSSLIEVISPRGCVLIFHPEKDTFPGLGGQNIKILIGTIASRSFDNDASNPEQPWVEFGTLTNATRVQRLGFKTHLCLEAAAAFATVGLVRIEGA